MVVLGVFLFSQANENIYASSLETPPSFEKKFSEVGYKSVEEAVKEFEVYCKCNVALPKTTPSISFTHTFGRFNEDKKFNANTHLGIMFVNKDLSDNIYKIDIRTSTNKLSFQGKEYTLQDGNTVIYFESHIFNFFCLKKEICSICSVSIRILQTLKALLPL